MQHINFYENIAEAHIRLAYTVVVYDGEPYYVLTVTDHKDDGVFRVYLDPIGNDMAHHKYPIPYEWMDEPGMSRGQKMDAFMEEFPKSGLLRKMMNSPKFNKFRPFPLGMTNGHGEVVYVERTPNRHTQQGLMTSMLYSRHLTTAGSRTGLPFPIDVCSTYMRATIMGEYPDPKTCLPKLLEGGNTGVGFHRQFAFIKGPMGVVYLAYKSDLVGYLSAGDYSEVSLAKTFEYTQQVVEALDLFGKVKILKGE